MPSPLLILGLRIPSVGMSWIKRDTTENLFSCFAVFGNWCIIYTEYFGSSIRWRFSHTLSMFDAPYGEFLSDQSIFYGSYGIGGRVIVCYNSLLHVFYYMNSQADLQPGSPLSLISPLQGASEGTPIRFWVGLRLSE